jgi:hypothetical protein
MSSGQTTHATTARRIGAALLALLTFVAIAWPSIEYRAYPLYVAHLAAEKAGLLTMGPVRASQILGRYFHGAPPAVRFAIDAASGAATFGPALIVALLLASRAARSHETRCGRCGRVLRGLKEPRCPHCGETL